MLVRSGSTDGENVLSIEGRSGIAVGYDARSFESDVADPCQVRSRVLRYSVPCADR